MKWDEECPECGSQDFEEAEAPGQNSPPDAQRRMVIYVCHECGTAWDAEKPTP